MNQIAKAGIYIHIPFCKSRCSYCDFATDVYRNAESVERYVNAVVKEISNFKFQISNFRFQISNQNPTSEIQNPKSKVDTIYFGGGTPSLLTAKQLEKILDAIYKKFSVDEKIEFTLEMNPATVTLEKLRDFKSLGVNRASFGVQTFDDYALKLLARGHDANDARETFRLLREAGFDNISLDLIAGLPRQTLADWKLNLNEALKLQPEHLSLYLLEIHEATPLAEQIRSKRQPLPDEDLSAEMYEVLQETTAKIGYGQYEISNFAKNDFESKHNSKYWTFDPIFAFGVSAHGFDGKNQRWSNERNTAKYVELIEKQGFAVVEETVLNEKEARGEYIFLGLRLIRGIDLKEFQQKFGIDFCKEYALQIERLQEAQLLEIKENNARLTKKGTLFSNEVFAEFI